MQKETCPQYWVGTLLVALIDPGSSKRILRLRIDQPIEIERAKLEPMIDGGRRRLVREVPHTPQVKAEVT